MNSKVPSYKGNLQVEGILDRVDIKTDSFGVPRIFAKNNQDLFFALGYIQARERMFQLQLLKRLVGGRISEIVGDRALQVDKFSRTVGFLRNSEKWFQRNQSKVPANILEIVDSYTKGINTFGANGPKPVEMTIMGIDVEPITKYDVLAFVAYMGSSFSEAYKSDPVMSSLEAEFGNMVSDITKEPAHFASLGDPLQERKLASMMAQTVSENLALMEDLGLPLFEGSNSWVISPSKSKSGKAMLSNDPHIAFSNPSIWFEAYLESPDISIYGHFLPLVPFPTIGFNQNYAWGLTMFENDDVDFYKENLIQEESYEFKGKQEPLTKVTETIHIKGKESIQLKILFTHHGPIINSALKNPNVVSYPISVKWNMFEDDNLPMLAFHGFMTGKNLSDFKKSASYLKSPGLNVVYADKDGNIAYFACGGLNIKNFPTDRILDGASGKFEWGDKIPFEKQPQRVNPPEGYIFTANHKHFENIGYNLPGYWQADDRTIRLKQLFSTTDKWGEEEMKKAILDSYFISADYLVPFALEVLEEDSNEFSDVEKKALQILKNWDRKGDRDSIAASIFSEFRLRLAEEIFLDEMGTDRYKAIASTAKIHHFLKSIVSQKDSRWWDNRNTSKIENYKQTTKLTFHRTIASLMGKLGFKIEKWQWERLHTLELRHPLGEISLLRPIFNSGPRPIAAGSEALNNLLAQFASNSHLVTAGPSMRMQIDYADTSNVKIINPLGQSGHRLSPHFQDQADMYANGEFRRIDLLNLQAVPQDRVLTLEPKK
jgi:penicillin amidase